MGVLVASGSANLEDAPGAHDQEPEKPEPEKPPEKEPEKDFVPFSKLEKARPGRRERLEADIAPLLDARLKPLKDEWGTAREQYEQRIQQQATDLARMQGHIEALQSRPVQAPAPTQAPAPRPDPSALITEAEGLLERNDLRGYHAKLRQANEVIADIKADERVSKLRQEMESRIPQQVPIEIQGLMAQHRHVAMAGQRGIQAVMLKDQELGIYGTRPGPERMTKAFQMADEMLEKINKPAPRPQYSSDSAAGLAGVPAARGAGGSPAPSNEPGYQPTDADRNVMRAMKWTADEFVRWKYPEKWIKR